MLEGAGEEVVAVVVVVGEEDEDSEEEPAEAGEVVRAGPQRHGRRRRPVGGGGPRVRVVRGAEAAAGPCTHLTLTTPGCYMWQAAETEQEVPCVVVGTHQHQQKAEATSHSR